MSLSTLELEAVIDELRVLAGGTLQKISAPEPRTVILELRIPGATHQLLVCAEADQTRIHRLSTQRPPSPASPLPIQNLLRAHLLPSKLVGLEAFRGERVVRLRFETPSGPRSLIAELTGRHGNLILTGADDRILGTAIPSGSTTRVIATGRTWIPPPLPETRRQERSRFEAASGSFPISRAIEEHYGPLATARALDEARRQASRAIASARKRVESALARVEEDESRARKAETFRRMGDLLAPIANRVPRGSREVKAVDYTDEGAVEVAVPLRPELSGRENLERYYRQYRRLSAALEKIEARRRELSSRRTLLASLALRIEEASEPAEVDAIAREASGLAARARPQDRREREGKRLPYRSFASATGRPIWVGRGAKENDELSLRIAKGNDLWLHVRGLPGSHVVVPAPGGKEPDEQTLLDACALAAHFSGAKGETVAEIAITKAKYVRKPKGSPPGAVLYSQEKSRAYRHDEARIARLLEQS